MNKTVQKLVSGLMAVTMIFFCMPINVDALTADDKNSFAVTNPTVYVDGTTDTPVDISFYGTETDNYTFVEGQFSEKDATGKIVIQSMSAAYTTDDDNHYAETYPGYDGFFKCYDAPNSTLFEANTPIVTATYIVPGDIEPGQYKVTVTLTTSQNADKEVVSNKTYTSTITVSEPVDSSNPKFTVYYEIANNTKNEDNDTFMEFDPGAEVWVDVYVKADQTVTMQAFDIYPLWADMLTYNSITAAENIKLEISEMTAANPHFLTEFVEDGNTNMTIGTTGTKLATLKFTLNNNAVYGTHYPVYFGEYTNLARAKNAESATVTYETVAATATVGAETLKTYTVTFDANTTETVNGMPDPATAQKLHNAKLEDLPQLTRDSYNFLGWATDPKATVAEYTTELPANVNPADDLTLYAIWKASTHTVTWKSQDGTQILDTTDVTHGEKPTYNGETPSKEVEGYTVTFVGWAEAPNATSGKNVDELPTVTANGVTYYAAFTETINQYTITFENTGDTTINPIKQDYGTAVTAPADPEKEGYAFKGWDKTIPATMPAEDVTITAKWKVNQYTITFNTDGGSAIEAIEQDYNTTVTAPTNPTKTGYIFKSWDKTIPATMPAEDVTITAQWDPIKYNIAFDIGAGVTGEAPAPIEVAYDEDVTMPGDDGLTKDGYVLVGWAKDENATEPAYKINTSYDDVNLTTTNGETVTLYAVWKQNVFQITYSNDPTTVTPSNVNDLPSYYNTDTKLEIPNPEADGYTFEGWTSTALNIDEDVMAKDLSYEAGTITGNIDLTAHWTVNKYTITFNYEDGSKYDTITQDYGSEVVAPAAPEKEGYTFAGWVDADNNVVNFPTTMPAEDMTLTATWTINQYTITFVDTGDTTIAPITRDYGDEVGTVANPTKTGYTFKSWDKEIPTTMPAEDMTITAQWTINQYTITFNTDGGSAIEAIEQDYNTAVTAPTNPTKTGYNFVKWVDENGNEVTVPTTMPAENITLKAIWEAVTYNVTLNANGGKLDETVTNPFEVTFNSAYGTLAEPARGGYKFDGWFYTNAENVETQITADSVVSVAGDHELVAKWTANEYTVTFDPANGGEVSTLRFKTDTGFTTPAAPEYAYHTFKGWKVTSTNGNWPVDHVYNAGTAVKDNYGDVTLTAQWEGSLKHVVEDYKYAPANYVMLRIETTEENTSGYKFGDIEMYYTADTDYLLNGTPVLVTLIPMNNGKTGNELVTYVSGNQLTDAGLAMLNPTTTGADSYDRTSGLINKDEVVNIADANAVYQMVIDEGSYYSLDQLSILKRLMADMDTGDAAAKRGTIADVNAIVTIINNAANAN